VIRLFFYTLEVHLKQLCSLLKISVSLLFLFLQLTASGQFPAGTGAGADEAGMGYACIMKRGFWPSFKNQALLAVNTGPCAGFSYENRFGIKELGTRTIAILIPAGKAASSASWSSFGYPEFRRDVAGLGCGLTLSEKITAGVQVDYCSERTSGEYNREQYITFEAGLAFFPSGDITIGIHIFNPLPDRFRKKSRPTVLSAGAGIELGSVLFAGLEAEMITGHVPDIRTGFEYKVVKKLWIRAGYGTMHNSFCFGTGYQYGKAKLDAGFSTHDRLGVTTTVSLTFKIR
jgi:hypothetical protein